MAQNEVLGPVIAPVRELHNAQLCRWHFKMSTWLRRREFGGGRFGEGRIQIRLLSCRSDGGTGSPLVNAPLVESYSGSLCTSLPLLQVAPACPRAANPEERQRLGATVRRDLWSRHLDILEELAVVEEVIVLCIPTCRSLRFLVWVRRFSMLPWSSEVVGTPKLFASVVIWGYFVDTSMEKSFLQADLQSLIFFYLFSIKFHSGRLLRSENCKN